MRRRLTLITTALTQGLTAPALAHVTVSGTSPAKGRSVKEPASAAVTFTGPIQTGTLRVTGPGGSRASVNSGARDPRNVKRILVELKRGLKAGSYKASWTITASDGHRQRGTFTFRVRR